MPGDFVGTTNFEVFTDKNVVMDLKEKGLFGSPYPFFMSLINPSNSAKINNFIGFNILTVFDADLIHEINSEIVASALGMGFCKCI